MAYSITAGNGSGYFAINSSTGEITLHASGVGNLSGSYVLTRHDDVANTNQQITVTILVGVETADATHPISRTIEAGWPAEFGAATGTLGTNALHVDAAYSYTEFYVDFPSTAGMSVGQLFCIIDAAGLTVAGLSWRGCFPITEIVSGTRIRLGRTDGGSSGASTGSGGTGLEYRILSGNFTYTVTPNKRAHFRDSVIPGGVLVKNETGLTLTSNVVPTSRTVYTTATTTASKQVDGVVKNFPTGIDVNMFDERMEGFNAANRATLPASVTTGDILTFAKSCDAKLGFRYSDKYGASLHSMLSVAVVDTLPTAPTYFPGFFSGGLGAASEVIEEIDESVIAALADPATPLDYDGVAVSPLDWSTFFNESFDTKRYTVANAVALSGSTGADLGEVLQGCATQPDYSHSAKVGYRASYLQKQFLQARVDSSLSTAERQRRLNQLIQYAIDCRSRAYAQAADTGDVVYYRNTPFQVIAGVAAKYLYDAGETAVAQDIYDMATTDSMTLDGNAATMQYGPHGPTLYLKEFTSSNYADAVIANDAYAATATEGAPSTVTFNSAIDWQALFGGLTLSHIAPALYGMMLGVSNGTPLVDGEGARFIVLDFVTGNAEGGGTTTNPALWDGTGGTFEIVGQDGTQSWSSNDITAASVTEVQFVSGWQEHRDWMNTNGLGASVVGYLAEQNYTNAAWAEIDSMPDSGMPSTAGAYWALIASHDLVLALACVGLTSSLWSGQLQTDVPQKRLIDNFKNKWALGKEVFIKSDADPNYKQTPTWEAFAREYFLDDNGYPTNDYNVPSDAAALIPALSSLTGTQTGQTTADLSVATDTANGTLYWAVTTSATPPSAAQIEAGQDHAGATAAYATSASISSSGTKTASATGLVAATTYYVHAEHKSALGARSSISTSASFTTQASGPTPLLDMKFEGNLTNDGSHSGTISSTGTQTYVTGNGGGQAAIFSATEFTTITVAQSAQLSNMAELTISLDFKVPNHAAQQPLISLYGVYQFFLNGAGGIATYFGTDDDAFAYVNSTGSNGFDNDTWHTLKVTYTSGELKVYVDSTLLATYTTLTGDLRSNSEALYIFSDKFGARLLGAVDNLKIYDSVVA